MSKLGAGNDVVFCQSRNRQIAEKFNRNLPIAAPMWL
jgi:hypothetical protein